MKNKKSVPWIFAGLLLIAAALFLVMFQQYNRRKAEQTIAGLAGKVTAALPDATLLPDEIPDYIINPNMEMPVLRVDGVRFIGLLEIPVHNLSLPITETWSKNSIRTVPGRFSGSAYTDNMILVGRNYVSHFACLSELQEEEKIFFTDADGNIFSYRVLYMETIQTKDSDGMLCGDWDLTLFTHASNGDYCIVVRCARIP